MWLFGRNPVNLPRASGPYQPGIVDIHYQFSEDGIFFRLFYPTNLINSDDMDIDKFSPFLPSDEYLDGISRVLMLKPFLLKALTWKKGKGMVPVSYGEKILLTNKAKCIIMSHGLGAFRGAYNCVVMDLVSRGFVVLTLEHRENSSCYTYYYKSKEDAQNNIKTPILFKVIKLGPDHQQLRNDQVNKRSNECCKAYEFLNKLNKGEVNEDVFIEQQNGSKLLFNLKDLIGNIDLENIGILGHSFGGATALLTLSKIPQLKCGILMDPWMFPVKNEDLHEKVHQPLVFINTQTFHIAANIKYLEKFYKEPNNMFTILKTTHEHQTDSILLIGSWLNWFMKKINPFKALKINNFIILNFLKEQMGLENNKEDFKTYLDSKTEDISIGMSFGALIDTGCDKTYIL